MRRVTKINRSLIFALVLLASCRSRRELEASRGDLQRLQHQVQAATQFPDSIEHRPGKLVLVQTDTVLHQDSAQGVVKILEKRYYRVDSMKVIANNPVLVDQLMQKTAEALKNGALLEASRDQLRLFEKIGLCMLIAMCICLLIIGVLLRGLFRVKL